MSHVVVTCSFACWAVMTGVLVVSDCASDWPVYCSGPLVLVCEVPCCLAECWAGTLVSDSDVYCPGVKSGPDGSTAYDCCDCDAFPVEVEVSVVVRFLVCSSVIDGSGYICTSCDLLAVWISVDPSVGCEVRLVAVVRWVVLGSGLDLGAECEGSDYVVEEPYASLEVVADSVAADGVEDVWSE